MAINDVIASALSRVRVQADLHKAQIVHFSEILRTDRELLLRTGWLQEIIRGWYMLVRPDTALDDTAAWYANFWDFTRVYLNHRFGDDYCLAAGSSLDLHVESPTIPNQVIVIIQQGAGLRKLMYNTSLMMYVDLKTFPAEIEKKQGLNVMSLPYALSKVAPTYFQTNPKDAELAFRLIQTPQALSQLFIQYDLRAAAARIIGAYQFLQDNDMAFTIKNDLKMAGMFVIPTNPFLKKEPLLTAIRLKSPYAGRIHAMWKQARDTVLEHFPSPPGLPTNTSNYLNKIEEIYQYDAYNSLSIEGHQVTKELINKVKSKQWDPIGNNEDSNIKSAMAARGYFDAFQQVKNCVAQIINGEHAATIVKKNVQKWYQKFIWALSTGGDLTSRITIWLSK